MLYKGITNKEKLASPTLHNNGISKKTENIEINRMAHLERIVLPVIAFDIVGVGEIHYEVKKRMEKQASPHFNG